MPSVLAASLPRMDLAIAIGMGRGYFSAVAAIRIFCLFVVGWIAATTVGAALEVTLDTEGWLCVGRTPIFPVGLYEVAIAEMPSVPKASFNTMVNPYWAQGPQSTPEHLAAARSNGFFLIPGFPYEKTRAKDTSYFEKCIQAVKDNDRLLVWNLFEEPSGSHVTVEQGEAAYQTMRRLDPLRPSLFVDFDLKNIPAYRNTYDIFAYDYYPIGTGSIVFWRNRLRLAIAEARPKPAWAVVQAFGHADPKKDWALPTPAEMRCMAYSAVIAGAQGLLFYCHSRKHDSFYVREHPEHWTVLQRLGAELMTLSPVLLARSANERLQVSSPHVDATLRMEPASGQKILYLIAANVAHKAPAVERHFPGVAQADVRISIQGLETGEAELIGSVGVGSAKAGRKVAIADGALTDSFDPYAVHVYKITATASTR